MKSFEVIVQDDNDGIRAWKFVLSQWKAIVKSREQMRRCFKRGEVSVNGSVAEVTKLLATGDHIKIVFDTSAAHESVYGREKLDVRYEDEDLAVVVKPSGKTMAAFGYMLPFSLHPRQYGSAKDTEATLEVDAILDGILLDDADSDADDMATSSNISPALGQQNRVPSDSWRLPPGLIEFLNDQVIVAKTMEMRSALLDMHKGGEISRTYRVICHGSLYEIRPQSDAATTTEMDDKCCSITTDGAAIDADCIEQLKIVKVTPSNEAGYLSTLDIKPHSPFMGVNIRRYLMSTEHPVVGDSGNTKPLKANRNKGLMSALVRVEFLHPTQKIPLVVDMEEPAKFEQLRMREERAFRRRQASDLEELRRGGLDSVSTYDRAAERPIAYIVGEKDFCDMRFKVSPATLIPRTTTETLVRAAIALAQEEPVKILDVGTGSGCLLLALLKSLPRAVGVGLDISEEALLVAEANNALHSLTGRATFQLGDLGRLEESDNLRQSFDILVCNPPYLDGNKADKLTKTFAGTEFEPPVALFAESDGYGAYELLAGSILRDLEAPGVKHIMARGGRMVLEIGSGMGPRVRDIFKFLRFEYSLKDKQDSERCLVFVVPELDEICARTCIKT
ncbi:hypothetical protein BGZ98_000108 [Dissophora globulifera]|nr:hypothetical protein BGZ98_000108 [Dissophora globulifera]